MHRRKAAGLLARDPDEYSREIVRKIVLGETMNDVVERPDRIIAVTTSPLPGGSWVSIHEDVTERRRAEKRIEYLKHHDALTGLPNREAFEARLREQLAKATENRDAFAIVCIDLDRFKDQRRVRPCCRRRAVAEVARGCSGLPSERSWRGSAATNSWSSSADGPQPAGAEALAERCCGDCRRIEIEGHSCASD